MITTSSDVCVRFAPSPTGFLHIGGARTALFNWLYARHLKGKFLLRVEDTDTERSQKYFVNDILVSLQWLGLHPDEEPLYQSKRLELYQKKAEHLIEHGFAYRCTCTEADVERMREKAVAEGKRPQYDRHCRELNLKPSSSPFVVRAKIPLEGSVKFSDAIRNTIHVENKDIDDFVLIRSNGTPTYNFSAVVDDVDSRITHILRGDDHINNTPKQIHLYHFFQYVLPQFVHLPMILGPDKKKLSKRHGAVSVNAYREDGFLPQALLNFLVRLGWSHGDQEVFTIQEMIQSFSLDHIQKSSGVFNHQKLLWLNGTHIRQSRPEQLLVFLVKDYSQLFSSEALARLKTSLGLQLIGLIQGKVKLLRELVEQLIPLCTPGVLEIDAQGLKWDQDPFLKNLIQIAIAEVLEILLKKVSPKISPALESSCTGSDVALGSFDSLGSYGVVHSEIEHVFSELVVRHQLKLGDLLQVVRFFIAGKKGNASLFDLLLLLPWDLVEMRLRQALK